jgi:hypothetical protein
MGNWSDGVLEWWSGGVLRVVAISTRRWSVLKLITVSLITDYFLDAPALVPTNHHSPITSHVSPLRPSPRPINEGSRSQDDNENGSFSSDLPIGRNAHKVQQTTRERKR